MAHPGRERISVVVFAGNGDDSVVVPADAVVVVRIGDGLTVIVVAVAMVRVGERLRREPLFVLSRDHRK